MINDFDFFIGTWDVANRRLLERNVGCREWDEFPATSVAHSFFDGAGNFDEITFTTKAFSGATVRLYDQQREEWTLSWISSASGVLTTPMRGVFAGGVGAFFADDHDGDTPIRARFLWTSDSPTTCRWEQAFSYDDERTWETNWTMDFVRQQDS